MISKEEVLRLAKLARLTLAPAEVDRLSKDLTSILGYVEGLQQIDVSKIDAMSHTHGATNVFRNDEVRPSLPPDKAMQMAPDSSGRFIRVPIVIDVDQGEN